MDLYEQRCFQLCLVAPRRQHGEILSLHQTILRDFARYILGTFTQWDLKGPTWSLDAAELLDVCYAWDRSSASLISRQRCRYIRNLMKKGLRSASNEKITTDWRNCDADYWESTPTHVKQAHTYNNDREFSGVLSTDGDLYELLTRAAVGSPTRRSSIEAVKSTFASIFSNKTRQAADSDAITPFSQKPILSSLKMSGCP